MVGFCNFGLFGIFFEFAKKFERFILVGRELDVMEKEFECV